MTEFPVDVLGILKTMVLRSLGNPNSLKYTFLNLTNSYYFVVFIILISVLTLFLIKFLYKFVKKIIENKKDKINLLNKNNIKEIFLKEKNIFKVLKYPIIGSILMGTDRIQVSLIFRIFGKGRPTGIIREDFPFQEGRLISLWPTYALCIFILAGCFIGLSFGNKMLRNIGILIYVIGILFILFGISLDYGLITNGLSNLNV